MLTSLEDGPVEGDTGRDGCIVRFNGLASSVKADAPVPQIRW